MKLRSKETLMLLPNFAMLVGRLALDKRVSAETKLAMAGAAAYFVSPIDLIPDFIPVLGQIDDLMVVLLIADGILNEIDPEIVNEHWHGDPAMLENLRRWSRRASGFIPKFIKRKLFERHSAARKVAGAASGMRTGRQEPQTAAA